MNDSLLLARRTERQDEFLALAGGLADRFAPRAAAHDRDGSFPHENIAELVAAGYHTLSVPKRYGGWGATLLECVIAQERLARGDGATALVIDMPIHIIGSAAESGAWPEQQLERLCRAMVEEGALLNSAASEPQLGSPSRGGLPATLARRSDSGWRISGRKSFVSGSPALTHFLITATLEGTDRAGIFIVQRNLPGVSIERTWDPLGMRSTGSDDLILEDVPVTEHDLLVDRAPETGKPSSNSAWFWLTVAAVYLGIGAAARDAAVAFAHERKPTNLGGQSIASTESIQRRIGEIEARLLSARSLLYSLAEAWSSHPDQRLALQPVLGICKTTATTAAVEAADLALLIAGGAGISRALPFERFVRDARAGLFHPPPHEIALVNLGRAALANGAPSEETPSSP